MLERTLQIVSGEMKVRGENVHFSPSGVGEENCVRKGDGVALCLTKLFVGFGPVIRGDSCIDLEALGPAREWKHDMPCPVDALVFRKILLPSIVPREVLCYQPAGDEQQENPGGQWETSQGREEVKCCGKAPFEKSNGDFTRRKNGKETDLSTWSVKDRGIGWYFQEAARPVEGFLWNWEIDLVEKDRWRERWGRLIWGEWLGQGGRGWKVGKRQRDWGGAYGWGVGPEMGWDCFCSETSRKDDESLSFFQLHFLYPWFSHYAPVPKPSS